MVIAIITQSAQILL